MNVRAKLTKHLLCETAGEEVIPIVQFLKKKRETSELELAEQMKIDVHMVRRLLYKLYRADIVGFTRKKDKDNTIYIYYWSLNIGRLGFLVDNFRHKRLSMLKNKVENEEDGTFFLCPKYCVRFDFDMAVNHQFKCPECGALMQQDNNEQRISALSSEIKILEKQYMQS